MTWSILGGRAHGQSNVLVFLSWSWLLRQIEDGNYWWTEKFPSTKERIGRPKHHKGNIIAWTVTHRRTRRHDRWRIFISAGPRPRPKTPTTKKFYPLQKRPHLIVKCPKIYKKYEFFQIVVHFFIIRDVRDITIFIIDLQTDMLPTTKKFFKYSLITLLKFILHYYCHIILWTFCNTFSIFLFYF